MAGKGKFGRKINRLDWWPYDVECDGMSKDLSLIPFSGESPFRSLPYFSRDLLKKKKFINQYRGKETSMGGGARSGRWEGEETLGEKE